MVHDALAREILLRSVEHLRLVAVALGLALLIALPLGLWIQRRPRWARPVLALASAVQTVPSLAIFGLLLTVPLLGGIGTPPAIVALTLYALLPLLRGTVTGLAQVPPGMREAGRALGLSERQVLLHIELPLALPTLMAGIRVATVIGVGVATIAAAIGAGGLGVFLFRGIATVNNELILAGALPAAAIALGADAALGALERHLARGPRLSAPRCRALALAGAAVATLGLVAALVHGGLQPPAADVIRIGSKDFTEQLILGELLAQQIEARTSLTVERRLGLGGTFLVHEGLRSGRIDGTVEYTGTAWTAILRQPPPTTGTDTAGPQATAVPGAGAPGETAGSGAAGEVLRKVQELYASRFDLTVFPSLGFENSFAVLIREADGARLGVRRIGDAVPHAPNWRAGFGYEFLNRADGFPGLARRYGLRFAEPPRAMDLGLTYRALAEGQVDLIAGDSTNGLIPTLKLRQLRDDLHYFPPYDAVPVFRTATLRRHPELVGAIEALAGRIDAATMRRLNAAVDLEKRPVEAVVRDWLARTQGKA